MKISNIIIIFYYIRICECDLTDTELKISMDLIKHLNVKSCIFTTDDKNPALFAKIKHIAFSRKIYITVKTSEELTEYVFAEDWDDFKEGLAPAFHLHKIAIVWKTNLFDYQNHFQNVRCVIKNF